MRAEVDEETCIGCGLCCDSCPELFRMTDMGIAQCCAETEDRDAVEAAIDGCPVGAISWEK